MGNFIAIVLIPSIAFALFVLAVVLRHAGNVSTGEDSEASAEKAYEAMRRKELAGLAMERASLNRGKK